MKYAEVKFYSQRDAGEADSYCYKLPDAVKASEFDNVLVETRYGVALAQVTKIMEKQPTMRYGTITKSVLEVIKSAFLDKETKKEKAKALTKKLKEKAKKMDEIKVFEAYAEQDPEFADMLAELKKLS